MINKTHKIVSVEELRTGFIELSTCMLQRVVGKSFRFAMASGFAIRLSSLGLLHIPRDFEHEGQILNKFKKFLSISH
jgi:hypothetical protein